MKECPDISAGRLSPEQVAENFRDSHLPLTQKQALVEAARCYFCYDAPCIEACPTSIDIPSFIRKIATGNIKGSAKDILEQNIMGGVCARVCPTEVLCEQACVRNLQEHKPVAIGQLQRYSTDEMLDGGLQLFARAGATGKRVAIVGGGPAGLACAHRVARAGHEATVFEARPKLGGLNEYGLAAYKVVDRIAQREVDYILEIGGIQVKTGKALGRDFTLADLRRDFDAVFLGMGLGGINALGLDKEDLSGVANAVEYIANLRQAEDLSRIPVARRVVVIGGGMTAIDIASQSKRLGAEDVTIVYRRGAEQMPASAHEQQFAQTTGVRIKHWAKPIRLIEHGNGVKEVEFEDTRLDAQGRVTGTGETFTLAADAVFKAIGQKLAPAALDGAADTLKLEKGRIVVDPDRKTSLDDVWAGGDCVHGGQDLTVAAVADGRIAGDAINAFLGS